MKHESDTKKMQHKHEKMNFLRQFSINNLLTFF